MPVSVVRLRRWLVIAMIVVCVMVGGSYLYLRHRVTNALKQVPGKIGIEIQQSAQQFTISKSEQGRTIFKLQAGKAVQFKQGGRAELHDVTITLYGHDSSRFDQVYGEAFDYDPQSGNVTSNGEVSIDLQSNPQGILHPDQTMPHELKNPIHLKTSNVVFNKNSGDAWTPAAIEFRVPQASGSAVGARYLAKETALTLESQIRIVMTGATPGTIFADRALLQKAPREIVLKHPRGQTPVQQAQAEELTLFLNEDNTLNHAVATGGVKMTARDLAGEPARAERTRASGVRSRQAAPAWSEVTAQRLDVNMQPDGDVKDAVFSGNVEFHSTGAQSLSGSAAQAIMSFGRGNALNKVHADGGVKLVQVASGDSPQNQTATQDLEIASPAMEFFVVDQKLAHAETIGAPEIVLSPATAKLQTSTSGLAAPASPTVSTRITADKFVAKFDSLGQLSNVHGTANARVVSPTPPQNGVTQAERITTSDTIDAFLRPGTGVDSVVQQGHFAYRSGSQQAFAGSARYTSGDQMLVLSGSPRIIDAGMETTARVVRLNRATGDGFAQGDVKTSYSDLKPQAGGALLATSDPVHVTAEYMAARANPPLATYTGNARLWQNANVIEAPSIQFQKEQRSVVAGSSGDHKVSTVLIGTDQKGNANPVTVTSARLVYKDSDRKAYFDGGVTVRGSDMTITARQMDVFLAQASPIANGRTSSSVQDGNSVNRPAVAGSAPAEPPLSPARLDKIVATGSVVITEPKRRATGENLTYTASDDKFVLTGGPPSIFDAEHGKITAVSLTLFRRDGRVVVEGDKSSPAVTETKVVR
ncbi:MAG TPA: LptA/OstA family protein [Terriglobales bacterium]|jgi:lipopolysaccharide export system protein LptA|nr:LptA/OstA family protein [Terriglobales bacterium]